MEAQKKPETVGVNAALYGLVFVLPIFGMLISWFSYFGVRAAQHAIEKLKKDWAIAQKQHAGQKPMLPGIIGGGHDQAHQEGLRAPELFPWVFILAWLAVWLTLTLPHSAFPGRHEPDSLPFIRVDLGLASCRHYERSIHRHERSCTAIGMLSPV